jgi:hypothetical protein
MARPPKYTTTEDKPASFSLRIPRDLYTEAQERARVRRTTLTELLLEGLRMRLDTPLDPRDILVSREDTVMQELQDMIDARVQAALAAHGFGTPAPISQREPVPYAPAEDYGNAATGPLPSAPPNRRGQAKLSPRQIKALRAKRARGVPIKDLMEQHSISRATVFRYLGES